MSSVTVLVSLPSSGISFTEVIVMISFAVAVNVPSVITYGNVTVPLKLAFGVNVMTPSVATFTVPLVTAIVCAVPGVNRVPLML